MNFHPKIRRCLCKEVKFFLFEVSQGSEKEFLGEMGCLVTSHISSSASYKLYFFHFLWWHNKYFRTWCLNLHSIPFAIRNISIWKGRSFHVHRFCIEYVIPLQQVIEKYPIDISQIKPSPNQLSIYIGF